MNYNFGESRFFEQLNKKWMLENISLPVEIDGNYENTPIFSLLNESLLSRHKRKQLLLPNFSETETVAIFSDYGGEHKESKYFTYTFLFVDYQTIGLFSENMIKIRNNYFKGDFKKEISFKDSHKYGPIRRCIDEYLGIANNQLNGLVFTLMVEKNITSLVSSDDKQGIKSLVDTFFENNLGKWKGGVLEKGLRILFTMSYFCKLLIPSGKKVFWMTDHDSIMPNDEKTTQMATVFKNCLNSVKYPPVYDVIGYTNKPFDYEEDEFHFRDLLSIADMVAGSIGYYYQNEENKTQTNNDAAIKTCKWLPGQGVGLKKLNLVIRKESTGFRGGMIDFMNSDPVQNTKYVDYGYGVKVNSSR